MDRVDAVDADGASIRFCRGRRNAAQHVSPIITACRCALLITLLLTGTAMAGAASLKIKSQSAPVEVKDCPDDLSSNPLLGWLKPNYMQVAAESIGANFQRQDPGMRLLSLRCTEKPRMTTRVEGHTDVVIGVTLEMPLEIGLVSASGQKHLIEGAGMAVRTGNGVDATARFDFKVAGDRQN